MCDSLVWDSYLPGKKMNIFNHFVSVSCFSVSLCTFLPKAQNPDGVFFNSFYDCRL